MKQPTENEAQLMQLIRGISYGLHPQFYAAASAMIEETFCRLDLFEAEHQRNKVWDQLVQRSKSKEDCSV